jgi:aspartyl protease family protein
MREETAWGLAALCGLLAVVVATFSVTRHSQVQYALYRVTELEADQRGHYVTKVDINNATVDAIIDTGATAVALSYEDAEDAGLKPGSLDYDVPVNTANGLTKAARVMLRLVEVDGVRVRDVEGLVLPDGAMKGTLLGMSFLSKLRQFRIENGVLHLEN